MGVLTEGTAMWPNLLREPGLWVAPGSGVTSQSQGAPVPPRSCPAVGAEMPALREPPRGSPQRLGQSGNRSSPSTSDPLWPKNTGRSSNTSLRRRPEPSPPATPRLSPRLAAEKGSALEVQPGQGATQLGSALAVPGLDPFAHLAWSQQQPTVLKACDVEVLRDTEAARTWLRC